MCFEILKYQIMELKINIGYRELFELIKQLPTKEMNQLAVDLSKITLKRKIQSERQTLKALLLSGPIMSEEQYENYELNRKWINQWREVK